MRRLLRLPSRYIYAEGVPADLFLYSNVLKLKSASKLLKSLRMDDASLLGPLQSDLPRM